LKRTNVGRRKIPATQKRLAHAVVTGGDDIAEPVDDCSFREIKGACAVAECRLRPRGRSDVSFARGRALAIVARRGRRR